MKRSIRQFAGKKIKQSTSGINPSNVSTDFHVRYSTSSSIQNRPHEFVLVPQLFERSFTQELLTQLHDIPEEYWLRWHRKQHWAVDEDLCWKDFVPNWNTLIEGISQAFSVEIQATRINRFVNGDDGKPFHHDAYAVIPSLQKKQNISIILSLGATRSILFMQPKTKTVLSFEIPNGMIYSFREQINLNWMHGIPKESEATTRYSIAFWGGVQSFLSR